MSPTMIHKNYKACLQLQEIKTLIQKHPTLAVKDYVSKNEQTTKFMTYNSFSSPLMPCFKPNHYSRTFNPLCHMGKIVTAQIPIMSLTLCSHSS